MTAPSVVLPSDDLPPPRLGVGVYILDPAGRVLLRHRTSKHGAGTWAPPGGHVEFGEDPIESAAREVAEEVGITLPLESLRFIGYTNDLFPDTNKHYVTFGFVARVADPGLARNMEPDKCDDIQWVDPTDWPDNLFPSVQNFVDQSGGRPKVSARLLAA